MFEMSLISFSFVVCFDLDIGVGGVGRFGGAGSLGDARRNFL